MEVNWKRDTKSTKERFIDDFVFDVKGTQIKIHQKPIDFSKVEGEHDLGAVGRTVWDASIALSKYLEQNTQYIKGKRVVELGSGTGLLGIAVSWLGASHVTLTDYYDMELLEKNVSENINDPAKADVKKLFWSETITKDEVGGPYDQIIGSDLIYYNHLISPLLATLRVMCGTSTPALLAYEEHNKIIAQRFLDQCSLDFQVKVVSKEEMDPNYQHPSIYIVHLTPLSK